MAKYKVTTEGGTYLVTTEPSTHQENIPEKGMFGQPLAPGTTSPADAFEQDKFGPGVKDSSVETYMTVSGAASLANLGKKVLLKGASSIAKKVASEAPNVVERFGSRGILDSIGISPKTLGKISGSANPAESGALLTKRLIDEKVVGNTLSETVTKMAEKKDVYGKAVGEFLNAIRKAGSKIGGYAEAADPLKLEANQILKPILDDANALRDSGYPLDRFASRFKRAMYNSLSDAANKNGGYLKLEDVRTELKKVGKMFNRAAPGSDNHEIVSELYGTLADIRDSMVKSIAEQSGNAKLAQNLLEANKGYSLYTRLLPDVRMAGLKEATGSSGFFKAPIKATGKALETPLSKAAVSVGGLPRKIAKTLARK